MQEMNRRTMLAASVAGAAAGVLWFEEADAQGRRRWRSASINGQVAQNNKKGTQMADGYKVVDGVKVYDNEYFYDADGKFLPEKAKAAYWEMFDRFKYPTSDFLDKNFWMMEFGQGEFARVGMGGVFWVNRNEEGFSYFGHDIYLLPFQMIAEHSHQATKNPAKMESWQVRYGSIFNFGEAEDNKPFPVEVPKSQVESMHSNHCEEMHVGDIAHLGKLLTWHFMMGGPKGAIVTEYANYHDNDGLFFSNPTVKKC